MFGLDPDHAGGSAEPSSHARDESPASYCDQDGIQFGNLQHQLAPERSLAGDNLWLIIGMHDQRPRFGSTGLAGNQSFGIDRTDTMNVSAIVAQLLHFDGWTGLRHKYLCPAPQLLRGISHRQPMIAARCRNHAGVWHGMGENAVESSARLK